MGGQSLKRMTRDWPHFSPFRDALGRVVPTGKRRSAEGLLLVILIRFLGRLSFWTAVLATAALFGTTAIITLLFWGLFAWFNENAPGWQTTFSQASAFFLIAVNGIAAFLGPLALVAARSARSMPDCSEPFWVRGWWQAILVVGLLLTLSAFLAMAWEPQALDILNGWRELLMITNVW